jgi:hypothetical protein
MADKRRIQKMKIKSGAFKKYAWGKVTEKAISKWLSSPNRTTQKRAVLARTFRSFSK